MGVSPLRLALLGCGSFGERHAKSLSTIRAAHLVAVFDPATDRARNLSRTHDAPAATSLTGIWNDTSIDAVIVATPTDTHRELTVAAAEAGKHVLVEKPAALSLEDLAAMQAVCDDRDVVLFIGQTLRYHPAPQGFRRAIQNGAIGEPVYFNWITNSRRPWPGGWRGWQTDSDRSGGILLHLGIHSIDLALWLLPGKPERVYAQGINTTASGLDTPDFLQITIRFDGGANALLELNTNLSGTTPSYMSGRLLGTSGQAEWALNEDGAAFTDAGTQMLFTGYDSSLRTELLHFVECCNGSSTPLVTAEQSMHALAAAIAAQQSIASHDAVAISHLLEEVR